jgi:hypothetical protein
MSTSFSDCKYTKKLFTTKQIRRKIAENHKKQQNAPEKNQSSPGRLPIKKQPPLSSL